MSDIYIRNMEMPQAGELTIVYPDGGAFLFHMKDVAVSNFPYKKGEATPLPDHGRLIDGDEFYKDINESLLLTDGFKETFNLWYDEQETVIPKGEW